VFIAGRIVDAVWHATHEEFETATDQVQAHTVVWVGTLILLAAGAVALARGTRSTGYTVVLIGAVSYLGIAAWHFWEHSQLRDPDLPHLLLVVTTVILFAGVVWDGDGHRPTTGRFGGNGAVLELPLVGAAAVWARGRSHSQDTGWSEQSRLLGGVDELDLARPGTVRIRVGADALKQ